jgi:hypothetical protein
MIWRGKNWFDGYKEGLKEGLKLTEELKKVIRDSAIDDVVNNNMKDPRGNIHQ